MSERFINIKFKNKMKKVKAPVHYHKCKEFIKEYFKLNDAAMKTMKLLYKDPDDDVENEKTNIIIDTKDDFEDFISNSDNSFLIIQVVENDTTGNQINKSNKSVNENNNSINKAEGCKIIDDKEMMEDRLIKRIEQSLNSIIPRLIKNEINEMNKTIQELKENNKELTKKLNEIEIKIKSNTFTGVQKQTEQEVMKLIQNEASTISTCVNQSIIEIKNTIKEKTKNKVLHRGIQCNCCEIESIQGIRYKCSQCIVNLCSDCFDQGFHPEHLFLIIFNSVKLIQGKEKREECPSETNDSNMKLNQQQSYSNQESQLNKINLHESLDNQIPKKKEKVKKPNIDENQIDSVNHSDQYATQKTMEYHKNENQSFDQYATQKTMRFQQNVNQSPDQYVPLKAMEYQQNVNQSSDQYAPQKTMRFQQNVNQSPDQYSPQKTMEYRQNVNQSSDQYSPQKAMEYQQNVNQSPDQYVPQKTMEYQQNVNQSPDQYVPQKTMEYQQNIYQSSDQYVPLKAMEYQQNVNQSSDQYAPQKTIGYQQNVPDIEYPTASMMKQNQPPKNKGKVKEEQQSNNNKYQVYEKDWEEEVTKFDNEYEILQEYDKERVIKALIQSKGQYDIAYDLLTNN